MKRLNLVLLGLGVIGLIGLGAWTFLSVIGLETVPCPGPPPDFPGHPPPWVPVGASILAFGLGHAVGHSRRARMIWRLWRQQRQHASLYVHLALAALLLLGVALLAYETLAMAFSNRFWPITFYVRCGAQSAAWATIPGAVVVYFVVGHWLWFPARSSTEAP